MKIPKNELDKNELEMLLDAMNFCIEQFEDSHGEIDPCCLTDMRCWTHEQFAENVLVMHKVADDLKAVIDEAEESAEEVSEDEVSSERMVIRLYNNDTCEMLEYTGSEAEIMRIESFVNMARAAETDCVVFHHVNVVPTLDAFLNHCAACGGNWTRMFLTGIEDIDPALYRRMPDVSYSFDEVCWIVNHMIEERCDRAFHYDVSTEGRVWEWDLDTPVWRELTEEEQDMSMRQLFCQLNKISNDEYEELISKK